MSRYEEEEFSKTKLEGRFNYASFIAEFILREELAKGGYEIAQRDISTQSKQLAEEICLYCGANEGLDFFSDDDVIRGAFFIMSEGIIQMSCEEILRFKQRIEPILPPL